MCLTVIHADITRQPVDVIVNAANPGLLGGGGVDGAIHRGAGPRLLAACRALPQLSPGVRCPPGEVRITPGFHLPARYVIHTVGPIWRGGDHGEAAVLRRCHREAVELARRYRLTSIAFPAISCGVYGYPPADAARVAVRTLREAMAGHPELTVRVCCFSKAMREVFERALTAS